MILLTYLCEFVSGKEGKGDDDKEWWDGDPDEQLDIGVRALGTWMDTEWGIAGWKVDKFVDPIGSSCGLLKLNQQLYSSRIFSKERLPIINSQGNLYNFFVIMICVSLKGIALH